MPDGEPESFKNFRWDFSFFSFFHLLFPSFSFHPQLSYIFLSFSPKTLQLFLFNDSISLKSLYFNYIRGIREPFWAFYLRSRLDRARECNRNSSRLDNNFDPSTMMFKNSCYVFHTVSFDPRRNGAPRNSSKRTFKLHTPLWTRFLYSYMARNVSSSPPSSCFLANSSLQNYFPRETILLQSYFISYAPHK